MRTRVIHEEALNCSCSSSLAGSAACQPAPPPPAPAPPPSTAIRDSLKATYDGVKENILKTAEQVPENKLAYQPTKDVRTFGQLLGHIANENYMFCGAASGGKGPGGDFEKTTKKADLQKALADSFAFCDQAFAGVERSDRWPLPPRFPSSSMKGTKFSMLAANTAARRRALRQSRDLHAHEQDGAAVESAAGKMTAVRGKRRLLLAREPEPDANIRTRTRSVGKPSMRRS